MKMKKIAVVIVMVSLLAMAFAGCSKAPEKPLVIGLLPDVNSLPFIVAEEEGLFEKEGVQVKLEMFKSASDRDAAFQSGNINGASSDLLAGALFINGGFDVAVTSYTDGRYALLASGDSGITDLQGLKDKEIAISSNTIIEYVTDEVLSKNNLSAKTVAIPQMPVRMEMLATGKIAAACLPDPLAIVARERGAVELTDNIKEGIQPGVMIFERSQVEKNKAAIRKFYKAYNKAVELMNTNADQYRAMLVEKAGFPEETQDIIEFPEYQKARVPSKEEVDRILGWMKKKELLEKEVTYEQLVEKGLTE